MGCFSSRSLKEKRTISSVTELLLSPSLFIRVNERPFNSVYDLGVKLGNGSFGEVRFCTHKATGVKRAVKIFRKRDLSSKEIKQKLICEMEILRRLDHPCIVRVFESFLDAKFYFIVMEHCQGGELFDEILKQQHFDEYRCAFIIKQLLSAVAYLHDNNIVHRDLKPENILFEEVGGSSNIKLIDFGTALSSEKPIRGIIGSAYYVAPEVLGGTYSTPCDIWSVGVILFILLSGSPPFPGKSDLDIFQKVKKGRFSFDSPSWQNVSTEAKDFICKMIAPVKHRVTALDALQDPWILKYAGQPNMSTMHKLLNQVSLYKEESTLQGAIRTYIASQMLSASEMKDIREIFTALDTNGDGKLSREELVDGYRLIYGESAEAYVEEIMKAVDIDHSGFIDYTEFVRVTMDTNKMQSEAYLKSAFDLFDYDGSGKISPQELKEVLSGDAKSDDQMWEKLVKEFDANGDGEIDLEEFKMIISKI